MGDRDGEAVYVFVASFKFLNMISHLFLKVVFKIFQNRVKR